LSRRKGHTIRESIQDAKTGRNKEKKKIQILIRLRPGSTRKKTLYALTAEKKKTVSTTDVVGGKEGGSRKDFLRCPSEFQGRTIRFLSSGKGAHPPPKVVMRRCFAFSVDRRKTQMR